MQHSSGKPFGDYIDLEKGLVDRIIFSDQAIYEMELERIFARCWNFMCHESQIPNKGDFFLSFIGEESVIATRDKTGALQVFLNSCRHRGNAVCRAESGNARSFLCTYHGWTFGLDGKLIGVPGYKDLYHEDLKREEWGLISAGKVQSYKGFVFATMDPDAPDLYDYLGEVGRLGLDLMAERGDVVVVEGVQKNQITCNWKLAVDNLFDWYHVAISHASAVMTGYGRPKAPEAGAAPLPSAPGSADPFAHRVLLGDYGHAISGPRLTPQIRAQMEQVADHPDPMFDEAWRDRPAAAEALGEVGRDTRGHPNIFPNLWIASGGTQLSLRLPKGPNCTEIWWFTLLDKNMPPEARAARLQRANHTFGPAGMLEQDDGENWDQSTRQTKGVVARRYPLHFAMNLGHGKPTTPAKGPLYIDTNINEHAQLWTYRAWAEWMDADNWDALKQHRSPTPAQTV
jgi:phenylpropionate dioxygenase-like ring-hydroxylating dioxygenase large terminal subunit